MEIIHTEREFLGSRIVAGAQWIGKDLLVTLAGGIRPHIGSVILAVPRPSLKNPSTTSSTSSVLNRPGHLDERPGRVLADKLAAALGCNVALVCGIHYDDLSPDDIEGIMEICSQLEDELLEKLKDY
jgi:hypothetical protein